MQQTQKMKRERRGERGAAVFSGDRGPALGFEASFMCHSECILLPRPSVCKCVCVYVRCIQRIYIWPEGEVGSTLVLAHAFVHMRVHLCVCAPTYTRAYVQRGSVVPAVLLFGTAHRVNPGQCVVKKPYVRRDCRTSVRATKREETRGEKGEGARGMAGGKEGGRRATQMCTVCYTHSRTHARIHIRAGNAFAMRTTVERLCPLPNQAAPARRGSLALERERVLRAT